MTVSKTYIVDLSIGTYTYVAVLGGSPCKHQAAVVIKYHEGSFNYFSALSIDDCMTYYYIACKTVAKDSTFYAALRAPIVLENSQITKKNINLASEDIHEDTLTVDGDNCATIQ
ncbi:25885_t:CDS:2 [Racocetra persica]|uniref:25885_t:CDS:1 n=1 Tax=Racocetra persica TaxID=160502 RepID=A0ACA9Q3W2_9GLOM|nr:25885_t:CDS:2 [Racocetra persica]